MFVAPSVAIGQRRHADIAELHDGRRSVVIELKQVWGADAIWDWRGKARRELRDEFPSARSPLHAVILKEGQRADHAANELAVVLLEVVHFLTFQTECDADFRKERGLAAYSRRKGSPASPDETDSLLRSYLQSLGKPYGPIVLANRAVDSKTGVTFSIHAMFAPVTRLRAPAAKSTALA